MSTVCIELKNGKKMYVELYEDIAPLTVKNFLKLVDEDFYKDIVFHRVIKNFMCQAGGYYLEDGSKVKAREAESIKGEFTNNGFKNALRHNLGVISMARTNDPNSASSQFFLCVGNCAHLDNNYAGFGKILEPESLEVLKELNNYPTGMVSRMFTDWPDTDLDNYTIKSIYRVCEK